MEEPNIKKAKKPTKELRARVPLDRYEELKKKLYTELYDYIPEGDIIPPEKIIYDTLVRYPDMPLSKIKQMLNKEHGIQRRKGGIREIAQNCGLPYTE